MSRIALVLIIALALFACCMFTGSVLSRASVANPGSATGGSGKSEPYLWSDGSTTGDDLVQAGKRTSDDDENDPDLPRDVKTLDKENYLQRREEYNALRRGLEFGRPFDPRARGRAIQQMEVQEALQSERSRLFRSEAVSGSLQFAQTDVPVWTPLGPSPLPSGFIGGPFTGRVTAVVVDPTDSNKVYLGTAQGGVWRSLNAGTTWESVFDSAQSQAIGSLALAPSNPNILYIGTGESNRSGDSFFGIGLYRIDNVASPSYSLVGPINPAFSYNAAGGGTVLTTTFAGRSISQIVVHPTQPGTVFVATSSGVGGSGANSFSSALVALLGLYRSTNADGPIGSITFQKLAVATAGASLDIPGTGNRRITDVVMEPGNPNNLIVGVFGNPAPNDGGIFRTTNALDPSPTFTNVLTINATRIQLGISKDNATGVVKVLAATSETPSTVSCSASATQQGVLRQSVDGGATWPDTDATAVTGGILAGAGGFCGGQCFYNVAVAIDPRNSNTIYVGGNVPSTCSGLMLRSSNGVDFVNDHTGLHADSHALFFDPLTNPSTIYTGNDGGVWKRSATAFGSTWTNLNSSPLNTLQFEGLAVHPLDRNITIGGTQDNGTELQQTVSGSWANSSGGDGGYTLIDQSATDNTNVTMYHTFFFSSGSQIRYQRVTTMAAAASGAWTNIGCTGGVPANGISCGDNTLFYAPMALGPGNPNTVYLGSDRLYRSTDRGNTHTVVSQAPISGGSPVSTIAISPQDDNFRVVGMQNGQVLATSTGSSTLVNITSGSFPFNPSGSGTNRFIGAAVIDPNNKDVAYIAFSFFAPSGQGIWKITNLGGAAGPALVPPVWNAAGAGIPSVPINALAIDPINSNHIYAGTDIGVYHSTDGALTWNPYGTGLPRSAVFGMAIQSPNRILRVATHGRGMWEISIPIAAGPNTVQFNASSQSVNEILDQTAKIDLTITRAGDLSGAATIDYASADGSATERSDYMATRGTLHFAAGEASKIVSVFIVDDRFGEGPETFSLNLSNPIGCTLGSPAAFLITINSDESVNGLNPVKDASFNTDFFVRQHYLDFLNREPDSPGLAFWKNQIDECTSQQCREVRRINVSAAFFLSIEFQQTGYLVERLYKVAYGDVTGTSTLGGSHSLTVPIVRLNEFLPDTQQIGRGVVIGQPGVDQILENNKQALLADFVQRSRFIAAYPLTMPPDRFVDTMNNNAGGVLSPGERVQLIHEFTFGIKTRAQVLRAIAEDPDLFTAETNRAFVLAQYFGYLRRNPNDAPELGLDYTGYDFWLSKLNQFNGNFVNAEMVKAFIVSGEYQSRFGP
jgi:hypothetical protein